MNGEPASLDVTNSSVTATVTAVFIIMKFIHHISIKTTRQKTRAEATEARGLAPPNEPLPTRKKARTAKRLRLSSKTRGFAHRPV